MSGLRLGKVTHLRETYPYDEIARMALNKLTLSISAKTAKRAKIYARRRGTTVSALVSRWFDGAEAPPSSDPQLSPTTDALIGILPSDVDERAVLEAALLEKHFKP